MNTLALCIYDVNRYVKEKLPKLFAHFKSLDCDGSAIKLMTTEWFLCIFCKSLPVETAFRIWDIFFYDGPKVIFRTALSVLKIFEEDLTKVQSELEMVSKLAEWTNDLFDADKLIDTCFVEFRSISRGELAQRRKIEHLKMAKTVNSEASQIAFDQIHGYTGMNEKAAYSLLADFESNHQSALCLQDNEGQMLSTMVDYVSFCTLSRSMFKWAAECSTLQNNAGACARTAMLLLFQALGGDSLRMTISFADMVIGFWQLLFGTSAERLKIAFRFFDTDRNGRLKRTNVLSVLPVIPVLFQHTRTLESILQRPEATDDVYTGSRERSEPEEENVLGNIEFCQRCLAMLFGDTIEKTSSAEGVDGPHAADPVKEIHEAEFFQRATSVAIIVEFFYINRTPSRTLRSFLWVKGFEDDLSFGHLRKFAPNFDRECKLLLNMIKAEEWPKEEEKRSSFFAFSPKRSDANRAGQLDHFSTDNYPMFNGKALVDFVLKIKWCRSRRTAQEWCQQLVRDFSRYVFDDFKSKLHRFFQVDYYYIYSLQDQSNLKFEDNVKAPTPFYVVLGLLAYTFAPLVTDDI